MFYCDAKNSDILRGSSHICCYLFRNHTLNVAKSCNLNTVDYLDIKFDLSIGVYKVINSYNKVYNFS